MRITVSGVGFHPTMTVCNDCRCPLRDMDDDGHACCADCGSHGGLIIRAPSEDVLQVWSEKRGVGRKDATMTQWNGEYRWMHGLKCTTCGRNIGVRRDYGRGPCRCPKVPPDDPLWGTVLIMNIPSDTTALFIFNERIGRRGKEIRYG